MRGLRNPFGIALLEGKLCHWEFILHGWGSMAAPSEIQKVSHCILLGKYCSCKEEMLT